MASVIGTMIFVVVFLLALGAMAYLSGVQAQSTQAQAEAESVASAKGSERLGFAGGGQSLSAQNEGGTTVDINHLILAYPNGTTFTLAVSASVPPGGGVAVAPLVPEGKCGGSEACLSIYDSVVGGSPPGSALGLLTSLGNTFWYYPSQDASPAERVLYTTSVSSTSSTSFTDIPGLSFSGAAGTAYLVDVKIGYYQSGGFTDEAFFAASAPPGSTVLACATNFYYSNTWAPPGCSSGPGASFEQSTCYSFYPACSLQATLFVALGPVGGTVQLGFRSGSGEVTAYVAQGSYLVVSQPG